MKLNFEKAFDRVCHSYLWATLAAMKMDLFVINLIKRLVIGAEEKVHVNDLFTRYFPLAQSLYQGEPISSQPLLGLLGARCASDEMTRLHINKESSPLYQLFAKNVGIFLWNT